MGEGGYCKEGEEWSLLLAECPELWALVTQWRGFSKTMGELREGATEGEGGNVKARGRIGKRKLFAG